LADSSVARAELADSSVVRAELADSSVARAELADQTEHDSGKEQQPVSSGEEPGLVHR
jgi:hypothetical protein